jgi:fatty-acyl-CoA synthase
MNTAHYAHWPAGLPHELNPPETSVYLNLDISARRYPDKAALIFYGREISYRQLQEEVDALAGYLQQVCGIARGDRVLLHMQNCPQFVIGFYAILRADAVVVPVNPMLLTEELRHTLEDSGARVALSAQELIPQLQPLRAEGMLEHAIIARYADYIGGSDDPMPDWVRNADLSATDPILTPWGQAIAAAKHPISHQAGPDDLACMPYTSGTTGRPKGCMHTHSNMMFPVVSAALWSGGSPDHKVLACLPMFHVTGMQMSMNAAIYMSATLIIMPRWDRDLAGRWITRYRITSWTSIPTMMIDFLSNPKLGDYDISSLKRVSGGGAAMPAAIAQKLLDLTGLRYMEGYGLSETIATTHSNPIQNLKQQCLGIPIFSVDSRVIDPQTHATLPPNEVGEIIMHGPQIFQGYWGDEEKTREAFVEIDGKSFFRSGDLGYVDDEGFFFFTDRLKRMINASGYKVWPAEVEAMMYRHPSIRECCIIAAKDDYRGETVKAVVVLKDGANLTAEDLIQWSREQMAAYKVPRLVAFVDALPKSATGKVMWRQLQEAEQRT